MWQLLSGIMIFFYIAVAASLLLYGINCYVMIFLYYRGREKAERIRRDVLERFGNSMSDDNLPVITTQIAVYNEFNVIERIIRAVCRMRYPEGRHEIQILDDSTDETRELIDRVVSELSIQDNDIHVIRRTDRTGFKAGAMAEGLRHARGELIAVFDADFVPSQDFLLSAVPFFVEDAQLGLLQARWGHLNSWRSLLTRVQSIGIDGHFMIEQSARTWNGLYMNFNGTAGIWRKSAIEDSGGWQWDTLTEDMDLSYRVQIAGWHTTYLPNLVVPAEIPEDVRAFKSQQFRWAKGSIQTALKLLPHLLRSPGPLLKKAEAFFHLTHYLVHPMMLTLSLLALPVLTTWQMNLGELVFILLAALLGFSMVAPTMLYFVGQRAGYPDWLKRIIYLPFLVIIGVGIAVSNSRAVLEAIIGKESGFVRTPKRGHREIKRYTVTVPWSAFLEILVGLYCACSLQYYLLAGKYLIGPFLAIYTAGFLFIGMLTVFHSAGLSK
ncbi:MAG: glycosyltransferase [Thermodesulfobacteriota bacterium]|nr:glycosyltransferase [Thermodesulfobacteriota bacterium]